MNETRAMYAAMVAVLVIVLGFTWLLISSSHNFADWCHSRGGHTHSLYKSTVCLTSDGRIIE